MTVLWWVPIHAPPEASYAFLPSLHAIQELWSFFLHLLPACCERQWPIWPIIHQPWMGQFGWFPSHPITIMYAEIVSQKNITKSMSAKLPPVKPWPQRLPKKVDFTKSDLEPPAVSSRKPQNFEQHSPGESHYTDLEPVYPHHIPPKLTNSSLVSSTNRKPGGMLLDLFFWGPWRV